MVQERLNVWWFDFRLWLVRKLMGEHILIGWDVPAGVDLNGQSGPVTIYGCNFAPHPDGKTFLKPYAETHQRRRGFLFGV